MGVKERLEREPSRVRRTRIMPSEAAAAFSGAKQAHKSSAADKKTAANRRRRDRARAMCPLARFGTRGLDPEFVRAVRDAVRLIAQDPEGEAFLEKWAAREAEYELF